MNDTTAVARNQPASRPDATQRAEAAQRSDAALLPPVDDRGQRGHHAARRSARRAQGQAQAAGRRRYADDRRRGELRDAGGHGGELRRSQRAPFPARVYAVEGARHHQGLRRDQARRAQPAHPQGSARAAAPDRGQGELRPAAALSRRGGGRPFRTHLRGFPGRERCRAAAPLAAECSRLRSAAILPAFRREPAVGDDHDRRSTPSTAAQPGGRAHPPEDGQPALRPRRGAIPDGAPRGARRSRQGPP